MSSRALEQGAGRTVIVPGGGPFADMRPPRAAADRLRRRTPRTAWRSLPWRRSARRSRASPLPSTPAAETAPRSGARSPTARVPVWLPLDLLDGHAEVPESWDMTSDSLAGWLAGKLDAARLIFLKRTTPPSTDAADLAAAGVLDPLTPRFLATIERHEAWLCGPRDLARARRGPCRGDGDRPPH